MKRRVVVTGSGIAAAPPDSAVVRLSVAAESDDVSAALAQVSELATGVGERLRGRKIGDRDMKTSSLSVFPRYDKDGQQARGFRAQHQLTVRVRDLSEVGAVISAGIVPGENRVTLDSVSLSLAETATLETQARTAAFADARRRASELADLADRQIGPVVAVAEVAMGGGFEPRAFKMATADVGGSIEAGEESVSVTLEVTFELV